MGDKASAAAVPLTGFGANDAHDLAVELEFHFGLRQQTRPLADFSRNGHLTLGRDTHDLLLTLTCKSKRFNVDLQALAGRYLRGRPSSAAKPIARPAAVGDYGML